MKYDPVFAGWYSLNGNGEMTGTTWVEESGFLEGPIMITNTHSVGIVRDAVIEWSYKNKFFNVKSTKKTPLLLKWCFLTIEQFK